MATVAFRGQIDAGRGIPNLFVARVLVLRPQPDGRVKVMVASTDLAPKLANVGADTVTTIDLQQFPERMCALPGDVVALATSGGYDAQTYPAGVPVQMFSRTPDSVTNVFKVPPGGDTHHQRRRRRADPHARGRAADADHDRDRVTTRGPRAGAPRRRPRPRPRPGSRARTPTPAPTTGPTSSPVTLPKTKSAKVRRKRVEAAGRCDGPSPCTGRLALSRKSKPFGSAPFALTAGQTERVSVKLHGGGAPGARQVDSGLTIKVVATTATGLRVTAADHPAPLTRQPMYEFTVGFGSESLTPGRYRSMPRCRTLLAVPIALLALAAPAAAEEVVIGSDLQADATIAYSDGNDWAAWNTDLASGGLVKAPVQGEVNVVNLKGRLQPRGPRAAAAGRGHARDGAAPAGQRLRRRRPRRRLRGPAAARRRATRTRSTPTPRAQLTKPDGAGRQGRDPPVHPEGRLPRLHDLGRVRRLRPGQPGADLRARRAVPGLRGDRGRRPTSTTRAAPTTSSPSAAASPRGREVLMNATIGTRENARYTCRTDAEKKENLDTKPVTHRADPYPGPGPTPGATGATPARPPSPPAAHPQAPPRPEGARQARPDRPALPRPGACGGKLALRSYSARAASFALAAGQRASVTLTLNKAARRKLRKKGAGLTVKAMVTHPDGSHTTRRFVIRRG